MPLHPSSAGGDPLHPSSRSTWPISSISRRVSLFCSFSPAGTVPLHSSSRSTWPFSPVSLHMSLFRPTFPRPASTVAVFPHFSPHSNCPAISIARSLSLSLAIFSPSGQPTFPFVCPIFPSKNSFFLPTFSRFPSSIPNTGSFSAAVSIPFPPPFPSYKNRRRPFSLSGFCPPPLTGYTISQFSVYGCFRLSPCVSSFQKPRFSHSKNRERPRFPHVRSLLLFSQISINSRNSRIMPIPSG